MQGKACIICNQSRSGPNIPYPRVQMGKFHTFMICKKSHLINSQEARRFEELINRQLTDLQQNRDQMVDEMVEGSQPDEDVELECAPTCHGVLNLKDKNAPLTRCTDLANSLLWTHHHKDSNRLLYFCKASYLVRYFFAKVNKQGCKVGPQEPPAKKATGKKVAATGKKAAVTVAEKKAATTTGKKRKTAPKAIAKKVMKKHKGADLSDADGDAEAEADEEENDGANKDEGDVDHLLTPPAYIEETRAGYCVFSRVWIVVEQSIGRVKNWAAARETLRLPTSRHKELYCFHHWVWVIISVLVNKYQRISHVWDE